MTINRIKELEEKRNLSFVKRVLGMVNEDLFKAIFAFQAWVTVFFAPLRWNFSIYKSDLITGILKIFHFDFDIPVLYYYVLYWVCAIPTLVLMVLHFMPSTFILLKLGGTFQRFLQLSFVFFKTILILPLYRVFVPLMYQCFIHSTDSKDTLITTGSCNNFFGISSVVIGGINIILMFVAYTTNITKEHSTIEKSKRLKFCLFDERSRFYHQFAFYQLALFAVSGNANHYFGANIVSFAAAGTTSLCLILFVIFEPYEDGRILSIMCGASALSALSNLIGLISYFQPYSIVNLMLFGLTPLGFFTGYFTMRIKKILHLKSLFKTQDTSLIFQSGMMANSRNDIFEEYKKYTVRSALSYLNLQRAFRGSKSLFEVNFLNLINVDGHVVALDLSLNQFTKNELFKLLEAIANHSTLRELDVSRNNINLHDVSIDQWETLLEFFSLTQLETINFAQNEIRDSGLEKIVAALIQSKNENLNRFDFSYCNLTLGCASCIRDMVIHTRIKMLYLQGNCLGSEGVKIIAGGLHENSVLKSLDLAWNEIGNEGCDYLIKALQENKNIRKINVGSNGVSKNRSEVLKFLTNKNLGKKMTLFQFTGARVLMELNGSAGFKRVADYFYAKVLQDRQTRRRFATLKIEKMRYLMSAYLQSILKNPQKKYEGEYIRKVHSWLKIVLFD